MTIVGGGRTGICAPLSGEEICGSRIHGWHRVPQTLVEPRPRRRPEADDRDLTQGLGALETLRDRTVPLARPKVQRGRGLRIRTETRRAQALRGPAGTHRVRVTGERSEATSELVRRVDLETYPTIDRAVQRRDVRATQAQGEGRQQVEVPPPHVRVATDRTTSADRAPQDREVATASPRVRARPVVLLRIARVTLGDAPRRAS